MWAIRPAGTEVLQGQLSGSVAKCSGSVNRGSVAQWLSAVAQCTELTLLLSWPIPLDGFSHSLYSKGNIDIFTGYLDLHHTDSYLLYLLHNSYLSLARATTAI